MNRYRIVYIDNGGRGRYKDVESNSLAHAIWGVAKEMTDALTLVDTMSLPSIENARHEPWHVDVYPEWSAES